MRQDTCLHPLRRTYVDERGMVFCWACRQWLHPIEAQMVNERWNDLIGESPFGAMLIGRADPTKPLQ